MYPTTQKEIKIESKKLPSTSYLLVKRVFDIIISTLAIILLLPILFIISILILILDGRPVIFKQTRTGINNISFTIWKFRTMNPSKKTSKEKVRYDWKNGVPDDFVFKTEANPNVTKLGTFLRKYSLDELPQFFNVLFGHMSIVGPRPEIPEITNCYDYYQKQRLLVKPGITGYAQVNGRSEIPHGQKIKYDLYYVDNCSIGLDIQIFFKTFFQAIFGKGAF